MPPEPDPEIRLVPMTRLQRNMLWGYGDMDLGLGQLATAWDAAPADYWDQIAEEYRKHRCGDPDCFTESLLMRLGILSGLNTDSIFGF